MNPPLNVFSVGSSLMGNVVYHANLCASLAGSARVQITRRSVAEYWDFWAKVLFATVASPRLGAASYRWRSEWVFSDAARRGLRRELRHVRPDIVHCHTQAHALLCARVVGRLPLVVTTDATARSLQRTPGYETQRAALDKIARMEERLFRACAVVGGVTTWVTDSLRQDYGLPAAKVRRCPPVLDTEYFSPAPPAAETAGPLRVIFVGHDFKRKGGDWLLDLVGGELAHRAELRVLSGQEPPGPLPAGVTWHRGIKPASPEMVAHLRWAQVMALPVREDCAPMALVEGMACGLPLISTQVMGVPDLVRDGVNGFCLVPGDRTALAAALVTLAQTPELRRRLGAESRRLAVAEHSLPAGQRCWEAIFTDAIQSHSRT